MTIRLAQHTKPDCDLVFSLSNDPLVRRASFNTKPIQYEQHCEWYEKAIADINILFFLVFKGNDFVGQIRFNRESEFVQECVVSLGIVEQFRGKHISNQFLALGVEKMREIWCGVNVVIAEVKCENASSNSLFLKGGFELVSSVNRYKLKFISVGMGGGS